MIDTIVSKWDDPNLIGIFVRNLDKTSALLGYVSTTEYIDPVDLFIEKEPELASKLIIYWVNKPDGLKTVFEGMYKIVDTYAHNRTNKSVIVKIEKNYNENMFKSLVGKKLSSTAVNAITEHFNEKPSKAGSPPAKAGKVVKKKTPPPTYPIWEMPERMTVRSVKDFFDYIIKAEGDSNYGIMPNGEYFSKTNFKKNRASYERADKDKRDDVLNKYEDGQIYKMPLFDKYLKDSLDAYYAGKKKIDVNGVEEDIPNFEKLYSKGGFSASAIKDQLEQMVNAHITMDFSKIKDQNNQVDNPPVKKTRKPKEPKVAPPTTTSLISGIERTAIRAGQAKLVAETEEASASTIQRAIKSRKARNVVAKMKADTASASTLQRAMRSKMARTAMAKMKADKVVISVPVPTPKKEKKPKYKISYASALKEWNMNHNRGMYCNPRKGSPEHKAVVALRL